MVLKGLGEVLCNRINVSFLKQFADRSMEELEVLMVSIEKTMEDAGVLFSEKRCVELVIGDSLGLLLRIRSGSLPIKVFWMSDDHIKPK